MRLSFAGLSIRGPLGTRLYFRAQPCCGRRAHRRPCAKPGAWATYLRATGRAGLADQYTEETRS